MEIILAMLKIAQEFSNLEDAFQQIMHRKSRLTKIQSKQFFFNVLLTVLHLDIIVYTKTNLMHNLFLVYFVNLYMFRAYLGPSSVVCCPGWVVPTQPGQQAVI